MKSVCVVNYNSLIWPVTSSKWEVDSAEAKAGARVGCYVDFAMLCWETTSFSYTGQWEIIERFQVGKATWADFDLCLEGETERSRDLINNGDGSKRGHGCLCLFREMHILRLNLTRIWSGPQNTHCEVLLVFLILIALLSLGLYKYYLERKKTPCFWIWHMLKLYMCIIFALPFVRCLSTLPVSSVFPLFYVYFIYFLWEIEFKWLL